MKNDIYLGEHLWTPIGADGGYAFYGNFDGKGHTIYGMHLSNWDGNAGLFGQVSEGTIKNLNLKDGIIEYDLNVPKQKDIGALAGYAYHENINNVTASNMYVQGFDGYIGGLVGNLRYKSTIDHCSFSGTVWGCGAQFSLGGIVGCITEGPDIYITNCMTDCYLGEIEGGQTYINLIVGEVNANANRDTEIQSCFCKGMVNASRFSFANAAAEACSFVGSGTGTFWMEGQDYISVACYAVVNGKKYISRNVDSSWTDYWVVIPGLNNDLPMQKDLFWAGSPITSSLDDIKRALSDATIC